jgi:hypothetical protein
MKGKPPSKGARAIVISISACKEEKRTKIECNQVEKAPRGQPDLPVSLARAVRRDLRVRRAER